VHLFSLSLAALSERAASGRFANRLAELCRRFICLSYILLSLFCGTLPICYGIRRRRHFSHGV